MLYKRQHIVHRQRPDVIGGSGEGGGGVDPVTGTTSLCGSYLSNREGTINNAVPNPRRQFIAASDNNTKTATKEPFKQDATILTRRFH